MFFTFFKKLRMVYQFLEISRSEIFIPLILCTLQAFIEFSFFSLFSPLIESLVNGRLEDFKVFDYHFFLQNKVSLSHLIFLLMILVAIKELMNYLKAIKLVKLTHKLEASLCHKIVNSILKKDMPFFCATSSGELTFKIRSSIELAGIYEDLVHSLYHFLTICVFGYFCFKISFYSSFIFLFILIVTYICNKSINRKLIILSREEYESKNIFEKEMNDYLRNVLKFKYSGNENIVLNKIISSFDTLQIKKKRRESIACLLAPIQQLLTMAFILGGIVIIIWFRSSGHVPNMANLLLLFYFFKKMIPLVMQLFSEFSEIIKLAPIIETLSSILKITQERSHLLKFDGFKDRILIKNLTFFRDKRFIFKNLSFEIKKGKAVAIMGKSGVGKTTFAHILLGLIDIPKESLFFDNIPIEFYERKSIRKKVHYLTQNSYFLNTSLIENFSQGQSLSPLFKKKSFQESYIPSICAFKNKTLGENGGHFSGGELKKLQLLQAFLDDKEVYILDEPTSHLDYEMTGIVWNDIFSIFKNKTLIILTHDFSICDRVDKIINLQEIYEKMDMTSKA